jgi:hypothetical protein
MVPTQVFSFRASPRGRDASKLEDVDNINYVHTDVVAGYHPQAVFVPAEGVPRDLFGDVRGRGG